MDSFKAGWISDDWIIKRFRKLASFVWDQLGRRTQKQVEGRSGAAFFDYRVNTAGQLVQDNRIPFLLSTKPATGDVRRGRHVHVLCWNHWAYFFVFALMPFVLTETAKAGLWQEKKLTAPYTVSMTILRMLSWSENGRKNVWAFVSASWALPATEKEGDPGRTRSILRVA